MKYSTAINNKTLKMNTSDLLKKIDSNGNGEYSQNELKDGIKEAVSVFAKPLITDGVIDKINKMFDTDKNGIITEDELAKYLQETYGMKLEDAKQMNVKDLLDYLQEHEPKKKKEQQ